MCHTKKVVAFIKDAGASDIPPDVMERALVCTVDLVSVALGGYGTRLSRLSRRLAIDQLQPATRQDARAFCSTERPPVRPVRRSRTRP